MKNCKLLLTMTFMAALLLITSSCASKTTRPVTAPAVQNIPGPTLYTAYNLWYEKPTQLWGINYKRGKMIPAGTKVKNVKLARARRHQVIVFNTANNNQKFTVYFKRKYHPGKTIDDYMKTMFTEKYFGQLTENFSKAEINAIKKGVVVNGMSRQAVIAAYGYPPEHKTPNVDSNKWLYWKTSRRKVVVQFDNSGKTFVKSKSKAQPVVAATQTYKPFETASVPAVDVKASAVLPISDIDMNIPESNVKNLRAIAVVIGNTNYSHNDIPDADFARNDAASIKKYLEKTLGYRTGNIIYELDATKSKFAGIFGVKGNHKGKLYNWLQRGKSDVFIYYSGHGAPDTDSQQGYFVPVDADPQNIALTGYSLQLMYDNIAIITKEKESPNVFVVIDSCFSGASEKGLLLKNVSPIFIEPTTPIMSIPNAVILTSAAGSEVSSWYPSKGHSMFTYFLLKGLKNRMLEGKMITTAGDLFDFVSDDTDGVPYWARRITGRTQTPQIMGDKNRMLIRKLPKKN